MSTQPNSEETAAQEPAGDPAAQLAAELAAQVSAAIGAAVEAGTDGHGIACLDVPATAWQAAARHVRDVVGMDYFDWLSAVDATDKEPPGVQIVVHVADSSSTPSVPGPTGTRVRRILLRTWVPDPDPKVASLTGVWPGAAWHERETFEMFGVTFDGFEDGTSFGLRPLLLPDGFEGTPLRKSFVLAARAIKPWPGAKEPGESEGHGAPSRRKTLPPGVPDPVAWGPQPLAQPASAGSADASTGADDV